MGITEDTKAFGKAAAKTRRASKDLGDDLANITEKVHGLKSAFAVGDEAIEDLDDLFDEIDIDGSEAIQVSELKEFFKKKKMEKTDDEIAEMVKGIADADDNSITKLQFKRIMSAGAN